MDLAPVQRPEAEPVDGAELAHARSRLLAERGRENRRFFQNHMRFPLL